MAMFINHSCDPNCETEEIRGRVWIRAIRNIEPGEEITYDYCLYDGGDDEATCNCGAKLCRGTMYSPEEIRRRKAVSPKSREEKEGKSTLPCHGDSDSRRPRSWKRKTRPDSNPALA